MSEETGQTRWSRSGGPSGEEYAARFEALAGSGVDVHGEAAFVAGLVPPGSRILDAGCGTGRVAIRLAEQGYECVGVDADESMLAVARAGAPHLTWVRADLARLSTRHLGSAHFDLVVMAGNVVPLLAEGTREDVIAGLTALLRPGGLLVAGFGLDVAHLPPRCPVTTLEQYDAACLVAGLQAVERFSTWDGTPFHPLEGYAVSLHRRPVSW